MLSIVNTVRNVLGMRNKNIYFDWIINRIRQPNSDIFDAGCAPGKLATRLLNRGHRVTGVDLKSVDIHHHQFTFIKTNLSEVIFGEGVFDYIIACHVLQHIGYPYQNLGNYYGDGEDKVFLSKMHNWLRSGGRMFLVVPIAKRYQIVHWTGSYKWCVYDSETLASLLENKFRVVDKMVFDGAYDTKKRVGGAMAIVLETEKID